MDSLIGAILVLDPEAKETFLSAVKGREGFKRTGFSLSADTFGIPELRQLFIPKASLAERARDLFRAMLKKDRDFPAKVSVTQVKSEFRNPSPKAEIGRSSQRIIKQYMGLPCAEAYTVSWRCASVCSGLGQQVFLRQSACVVNSHHVLLLLSLVPRVSGLAFRAPNTGRASAETATCSPTRRLRSMRCKMRRLRQ